MRTVNKTKPWIGRLLANPTVECVLWPFSKKQNGYGQAWHKGRLMPAHRLTLMLATGKNPDGLQAAHSCRNRDCVNPAHLSWKTLTENCADRLRDGTDSRGEKHVLSKLTLPQAQDIYDRRHSGELQKEIALEYGITRQIVGGIQSGNRWPEVIRD